MGRFHVAAIDAAGGRLAAVVDPDLRRAVALAGGAEVAESLSELAAHQEPVDVVHVCTPAATHVELVEQALTLGAHVIVEKPVAPDAAGTGALLAAAEHRDLMLVPVHQFLFQRGVQRLLAALPSYGMLVRCAFEATTAGADGTAIPPDELVADILPHPLALFSRLAPGDVDELDWSVSRPAPGELRALAHSSGTSFEITISTRGRPTRAGLEVVGTQASARADLFHGFAVVERGAPSRVRKAARPFTVAGATLAHAGGNLALRAWRRETAYPGLRELVLRTYQAIATGAPAPIDRRETLAVASARDRILRS